MSINLRKPSQAFIAPGSITANEIAAGAIDLTSDKVTGELPNAKLASVALDSSKITGELPNTKLAAIADVNKISDGLVTLAKVHDDVRLVTYVGAEEEQSVTGTTEAEIITTGWTKKAGVQPTSKIRILASMKVEGVGETATLNVYLNAEPTPRLTLTSTSETYELKTGEFDVSALADGKHQIKVKAKASVAGAKCWNDDIQINLVK